MRPGLVATCRDAVEEVLDLVAPRVCVGCGSPRCLLCPPCGLTLAGPAFATSPDPAPTGFPPTWAVCAYVGPARAALLAHKERNRLGLVGVLGAALARSAAAAASDRNLPVLLVPVPSSAAATRQRGHDPLLRCARAAAYTLRLRGLPAAVVPALTLHRSVSDQAGLSATARAANLSGAHRVRTRELARVDRSRHQVVVVDDVVTTGASLVEASRALRAAGCPPTGAAVVAATARHPRLDHGGPTA